MGWPLDAGWIHRFLDPSLGSAAGAGVQVFFVAEETAHGPNPFLIGVSIAAGLAGLAVAFLMYFKPTTKPASLAASFRGVYSLLLNKYWVDEFYHGAVVRPMLALSNGLWRFDTKIVDGAVNGVGLAGRAAAWVSSWADQRIVDRLVNLVRDVLQWTSGTFRKLQTGLVQNYALAIVIGGVLILSAVLIF